VGPAGRKDPRVTSDAVPGPRGDAIAGSPPRDVQVRLATTPADWAVALTIRLSVFVLEQGVPLDEELDAHDAEAVHVLAHADGRAVGTGRYYVEDGCAIIGRMAVLPAARGAGVGGAILTALLAHARQYGLPTAALAAQLHARPFYARFGFVVGGPLFLDAGILHQRMERAL
jgi:predicted GNAT family N-acyltransferase